ncbi:MAG: ATP/GTP-binding protein [Actinomycetota bacterium]|nr:ATP/GTP-binding protein [Actinomycetota bacterium]
MPPPRATASKGRRRSRSVKIVVTGPFGAGKTTLIGTISEIPVLSTEKQVTDETRAVKPNTTVAMDFGRLTIDRELQLYLFGTPGQKRFDFMWQILAEGMLGFIVLVDGQRDESLPEAREILVFFRDVARVPYVVAVTKAADDPDVAVKRARAELDLDDAVRVVACDAHDRGSVKDVLLELLYAALDDVGVEQPAAV